MLRRSLTAVTEPPVMAVRNWQQPTRHILRRLQGERKGRLRQCLPNRPSSSRPTGNGNSANSSEAASHVSPRLGLRCAHRSRGVDGLWRSSKTTPWHHRRTGQSLCFGTTIACSKADGIFAAKREQVRTEPNVGAAAGADAMTLEIIRGKLLAVADYGLVVARSSMSPLDL